MLKVISSIKTAQRSSSFFKLNYFLSVTRDCSRNTIIPEYIRIANIAMSFAALMYHPNLILDCNLMNATSHTTNQSKVCQFSYEIL